MEKKWCHITDDHTFQEDLEIIYLFSLGNTNTYDIFGVSLAISATQHYFLIYLNPELICRQQQTAEWWHKHGWNFHKLIQLLG